MSQEQDQGKSNLYVTHIRPGIVTLLMKRIHTTPWITMRELVANSYDQYQKKGLEHKEPLVIIELSKSRKYLTVEDFATGIEDKEDFCFIGNEDLEGIGKTVGDMTSSSSRIIPTMLGQYHIAKMSYPSLSEVQEVKIFSNNGKEGYKLKMLRYGWGADEQRYPEDVKEAALNHIGLKVEIVQAKREVLQANEIGKRLGEWFGILISRKKLKIVIRDLDDGKEIDIQKPDWLRTDNETTEKQMIKMSSGAKISTRLQSTIKEQKSNNIYVFVKHVGITKIYVPFFVMGWVNCDGLTNYIDLSRDRLLESPFVTEFYDKLEKYLLDEGYERRIRESEDMRCPKRVTDLANLAQKISNKIFDTHVELTGTPLKDQPENPTQDGILNKTQTEIEKRNKQPDPSEPKPREKSNIPPRVRKPKNTHIVNRNGGEDENGPNVKIIQDFFGKEPTVYFASAEELHINKDRDASKIIIRAPNKSVARIVIPFVAYAATAFRMKEMSPSIDAFTEKLEAVLDGMWQEA